MIPNIFGQLEHLKQEPDSVLQTSRWIWQQATPCETKFSPNDCLFEARFYEKFIDLADFEGGTIYDTSSGCFLPVRKAEYKHNGLQVFVDCHDYLCDWRQPFFYSTNKTLAQQLVPVQFMLHKDA